MANNNYLTVKEAAEILSLTEETIRDTCRRGDLKAYKVNRRWRIPMKNLNAYLREEGQDEVDNDLDNQNDKNKSGEVDNDDQDYLSSVPF